MMTWMSCIVLIYARALGSAISANMRNRSPATCSTRGLESIYAVESAVVLVGIPVSAYGSYCLGMASCCRRRIPCQVAKTAISPYFHIYMLF